MYLRDISSNVFSRFLKYSEVSRYRVYIKIIFGLNVYKAILVLMVGELVLPLNLTLKIILLLQADGIL